MHWCIHSEKSLLWDYGGHPDLPSAAALFDKQNELLKFCDPLWPTKSTLIKDKKEKARSENPGMFWWPYILFSCFKNNCNLVI